MRYVIYETARPVVPLLKEIEFLKNYVDIQSVRFNKEIKISFQSQGINETAYIEPMLLLPFIENIFKHGLQEEAGKGFAEIIICLEGNELMLEARNSKPGAPVAIKEAREKDGIGLDNVQQRLELLYKGKYHLVIDETEKQYEIILNLQLVTYD